MKSPREGRWSVGSRLSEDLVKADASIVKGLDKGGMTGNLQIRLEGDVIRRSRGFDFFWKSFVNMIDLVVFFHNKLDASC